MAKRDRATEEELAKVAAGIVEAAAHATPPDWGVVVIITDPGNFISSGTNLHEGSARDVVKRWLKVEEEATPLAIFFNPKDGTH